MVEADHTLEGGMLAFERMQARGRASDRDHVFERHDRNRRPALGLFDRAARTPKTLSIIGFDDIRFAQFTTPPLTTVQMSRTDLARTAFQALRDAR